MTSHATVEIHSLLESITQAEGQWTSMDLEWRQTIEEMKSPSRISLKSSQVFILVDYQAASALGRHERGVSRSKRMLSDERSNILIYLTGHGGEDFLKFRGTQDLMAQVQIPLYFVFIVTLYLCRI